MIAAMRSCLIKSTKGINVVGGDICRDKQAFEIIVLGGCHRYAVDNLIVKGVSSQRDGHQNNLFMT